MIMIFIIGIAIIIGGITATIIDENKECTTKKEFIEMQRNLQKNKPKRRS